MADFADDAVPLLVPLTEFVNAAVAETVFVGIAEADDVIITLTVSVIVDVSEF